MASDGRFTVTHLTFSFILGIVVVFVGLTVISLIKKALLHPAPTTTSPLKVRGGAMTFRTAPNTNFGVDSNQNPCFVIPKSGATMELYADPTGPNTPFLKNPDQSQGLQDGVQFDLIGHNAKGDAPSVNGVRIYITSGCSGNNLGASLIPESDHNGSDFYHYRRNQHDDDGSYIRRFLDNDCAKPTGSYGTANDDNKDEDTCEHLAIIYVNVNRPPAQTDNYKSSAAQTWKCLNGDCVLQIRTP
jgi:hypothetical protein